MKVWHKNKVSLLVLISATVVFFGILFHYYVLGFLSSIFSCIYWPEECPPIATLVAVCLSFLILFLLARIWGKTIWDKTEFLAAIIFCSVYSYVLLLIGTWAHLTWFWFWFIASFTIFVCVISVLLAIVFKKTELLAATIFCLTYRSFCAYFREHFNRTNWYFSDQTVIPIIFCVIAFLLVVVSKTGRLAVLVFSLLYLSALQSTSYYFQLGAAAVVDTIDPSFHFCLGFCILAFLLATGLKKIELPDWALLLATIILQLFFIMLYVFVPFSWSQQNWLAANTIIGIVAFSQSRMWELEKNGESERIMT